MTIQERTSFIPAALQIVLSSLGLVQPLDSWNVSRSETGTTVILTWNNAATQQRPATVTEVNALKPRRNKSPSSRRRDQLRLKNYLNNKKANTSSPDAKITISEPERLPFQHLDDAAFSLRNEGSCSSMMSEIARLKTIVEEKESGIASLQAETSLEVNQLTTNVRETSEQLQTKKEEYTKLDGICQEVRQQLQQCQQEKDNLCREFTTIHTQWQRAKDMVDNDRCFRNVLTHVKDNPIEYLIKAVEIGMQDDPDSDEEQAENDMLQDEINGLTKDLNERNGKIKYLEGKLSNCTCNVRQQDSRPLQPSPRGSQPLLPTPQGRYQRPWTARRHGRGQNQQFR